MGLSHGAAVLARLPEHEFNLLSMAHQVSHDLFDELMAG
jgi:hypothetical protein